MVRSELEVLIEQLDELLDEGASDGDDALEIAMVAGLAERLGGSSEVLARAEAWRRDVGEELLEEGWDEVDVHEVVDRVEEVAYSESASEEDLEEALYDFDDLVAAAVWSGQTSRVRQAAKQVAEVVRSAPESFAPLADFGRDVARSVAAAQDPGLYDYWMAVADADAG